MSLEFKLFDRLECNCKGALRAPAGQGCDRAIHWNIIMAALHSKPSHRLQWKTSERVNRYLNYTLKVTTFENLQRRGWTIAIAGLEKQPRYVNASCDASARIEAERRFAELTRSVNCRASPHSNSPWREMIGEILKGGRLAPELSDQYVELEASLEREG